MATTERERWSDCLCPECGGWMRYYGSLRNKELMCGEQCHKTLYPYERFISKRELENRKRTS